MYTPLHYTYVWCVYLYITTDRFVKRIMASVVIKLRGFTPENTSFERQIRQ